MQQLQVVDEHEPEAALRTRAAAASPARPDGDRGRRRADWGDRRESNPRLRGHRPASCPLDHGRHREEGSRFAGFSPAAGAPSLAPSACDQCTAPHANRSRAGDPGRSGMSAADRTSANRPGGRRRNAPPSPPPARSGGSGAVAAAVLRAPAASPDRCEPLRARDLHTGQAGDAPNFFRGQPAATPERWPGTGRGRGRGRISRRPGTPGDAAPVPYGRHRLEGGWDSGSPTTAATCYAQAQAEEQEPSWTG